MRRRFARRRHPPHSVGGARPAVSQQAGGVLAGILGVAIAIMVVAIIIARESGSASSTQTTHAPSVSVSTPSQLLGGASLANALVVFGEHGSTTNTVGVFGIVGDAQGRARARRARMPLRTPCQCGP